MNELFITATDTDAGKTYVARALVTALVNQGQKVAVYKPVSAGCELIDGQLINEDASLLQSCANCQQSISQINPIAFAEPIAPHIAAEKSGQQITLSQIITGYRQLSDLNADTIVTEGAGGWRLPLGQGHYLSDFAKQGAFQVVLVVNMKLGCLNHAMLSYEAIKADGLQCVGWVANCQQQMPYLDENIAQLSQLLPMPLIARLGNCPDIDKAAAFIDTAALL
ncbi:dethiobiotin synthase [Thalassomonas actiniarum]|uniref:ATP-dependent dethiobiotin synthetase BioD n=1 Tax=Thalassomonas actiniarum TaxID=485447 RepID=A0AAE9YXY7_9GAMM|nr:dethiobiotin synthase [Thalassomonas actiniarum]WDE01568.1 dethiobiotin synthase [Thalassomonas actiniarum]